MLTLHAPPIPALKPPTVKLPKEFFAVSEIAKNLPSLTQSGAEILRREIRKIPLLDVEKISHEGEVRLALLCYQVIQSAYIHAEKGELVIPKNIAIPSCLLSEKLDEGGYSKPPMLSYFSLINDNWKLKDGDAPFSFENLEPLVTFTGTKSEVAFILTHLTPFEHVGESALRCVVALRTFVENHDFTGIRLSLEVLTGFLSQTKEGFAQIEKYVSPDVYRTTVRPYLMSFNGIVYDGVEKYGQAPQNFTGPSGAQTVTTPTFSLALGIRYKNPKIIESIMSTQKYLHPRHQMFLNFIEEGPNLWEYLKKNRNETPWLTEAYNTCLKALEDFRVSHAKFVASYIAPSGTDPRGTGNTVIPWWLNAIIEEMRGYYL